MNKHPLATEGVTTEPMVVKVVFQHLYGTRVIRPVCDNGKKFAAIANTKTLTPQLVEQIKGLGYTVQVIPTEPKEL